MATRYLFQFQMYLTPAWWFALRNPIPIPEGSALCSEDRAEHRFRTLKSFPPLPVPTGAEPVEPICDPEANYRFLRRRHHPSWVWYVFLLRSITFRAGPREWFAFWRAKGEKRLAESANTTQELAPQRGFSPKVSVIIATLNRYSCLSDLLADLARQSFRPYEILIVDQSNPFKEHFYATFNLPIRVLRQSEPALWLARNTAIRESTSEWIALLDDDVRLAPDWLEQHLRCVQHFRCDISVGTFYPIERPQEKEQGRFCLSPQFNTNNSLLNRRVFEKIGLFDRQFEGQRKGDFEFGVRAHLAGFSSVLNPSSAVADVKAATGGLRSMGSWDSIRTKGFLSPVPVPSALYLMRRYFGLEPAFCFMILSLVQHLVPYRYKRSRTANLLIALLGIFLLPLTLIRALRSWRQAAIKLRQGPRIEMLQPRDSNGC